MQRRLYRSRRNRIFLGVCGGLGEYFQVDPVIIRVIAVLLLIPGVFPAVIAYFILAIIIPLKGSTSDTPESTIRENISDMKDTTAGLGKEIRTGLGYKGSPGVNNETRPEPSSSLYILGIIIIAIGVFFLLFNLFSWFSRFTWPILLIIAGVIILIMVARRR